VRYHVSIGDAVHQVEVDEQGVRLNGKRLRAEIVPAGAGLRSFLLEGASHRILAGRTPGGMWSLRLDGRRYFAEVVDDRTRALRALAGEPARSTGVRPLRAPMPGLVVKVEVGPGDAVVQGQGLVVVEAMKMENELRAETAARVKAVHAQPGQTIEKDQLLVEFEPHARKGEA
jgi:pyruvate carboxylase subunit B